MTINWKKWEKAQWIVGDTPKLWKLHHGKPWISIYIIPKIFESIFRGIGQVCFANNSWSGILILVGLFVADPFVGLAALLASVASLSVSKILDQPDADVVSGLQNYNAVLVGTVTIALFPVFFQSPLTVLVWCGIFVMGAFSVFVVLGLNIFLSNMKVPIFTLPFNIVQAILFLVLQSSGYALQGHAAVNITGQGTIDWGMVFEGTIKSAGQVYAVDSIFCSIIIIVGLMLNSPILTLMSLVGGLLSTLIGLMITTPPYSAVYAGVWGYNGFLAAGCIAFFVYPNVLAILVALLNAIFCTLIQCALQPAFSVNNLPVMTFPFCISSLLFLALVQNVPGLERVKELTFPEYHIWTKRKELKAAQRIAEEEGLVERTYTVTV